MAHYALVALQDIRNDFWRPCAILVAGTAESASRQAVALRRGGGLAFVPSPSKFRIRLASRSEIDMLVGFFQGMGAPPDGMYSQADMDSSFARRQKMLLSFFLALYLNPEALRRKYAIAPGASSSGTTGGGGAESEMAAPSLIEPQVESAAVQEASSIGAQESLVAEEEMETDSESSPLGSDNQENALLAILSSDAANDGGSSREQSFDLDML